MVQPNPDGREGSDQRHLGKVSKPYTLDHKKVSLFTLWLQPGSLLRPLKFSVKLAHGQPGLLWSMTTSDSSQAEPKAEEDEKSHAC